MNRRINLVLVLIVFTITLLGCNSQVSVTPPSETSEKANVTPPGQTIEPDTVEWITMKGGLAMFASKVLFPARDAETISKIVQLINSSSAATKDATEKDMKEVWRGHGGGAMLLTVKLKDSKTIELQTLWQYTSKTVPNGTEVTGNAYSDRVLMTVESDGKKKAYIVSSEELAKYVLKGWNIDMPSVVGYSITPSVIKPGEKVTISGDGSTEKEISVFVTDGSFEQHYLIGKVPTTFGAWKWEGTIKGRLIKTLDGKEIQLEKNRIYRLEAGPAVGGEIQFK